MSIRKILVHVLNIAFKYYLKQKLRGMFASRINVIFLGFCFALLYSRLFMFMKKKTRLKVNKIGSILSAGLQKHVKSRLAKCLNIRQLLVYNSHHVNHHMWGVFKQ